MKANELMIGDWVNCPKLKNDEDDGNMRIKQLYSADLDCDSFKELKYSEIQPIPLTPEILEKNGFIIEEREGDPTFPYLAFIIENDEYRVEITWYDSHDVYEPNTGEYLHGAPEVWNMDILGKCGNYDCGKNKLYLHEFQHALKLCGIEKNIII